jgi:hypothetical protein
MIVRIEKQPFATRSDRLFRLHGFSLVALGVGLLSIWDPLTRPGPKVCGLRYAVGLPCPLCGMTRGVSLCLHGHPELASVFNPLAVPVLIVAVVLAIKWAIEFGTGRRFAVIVPPWLWRGLVKMVYVVFAANWAYLLIYRREDPFDSTILGHIWAMLAR